MKSITIHGMDETLAKHLQKKAYDQGQSLNITIKQLLRKSLGLDESKKTDSHRFDEFVGTWSKEEANEFEKAIADLEQVDKEEWM